MRDASSEVPGSPPGNGVSAADGSRDGGGLQSIAKETPGRSEAMTTKPLSPRAAQIRPWARRSAWTLLPTPTPPDVLKAGSLVITRMMDVSGVPVVSTTSVWFRKTTELARSGEPSANTIVVSVTGHRDMRSATLAPRITGPIPMESTISDASGSSHRDDPRAALAAEEAAALVSRRPGSSPPHPAAAAATRARVTERRFVTPRLPNTRSRPVRQAPGHSRQGRSERACSSGSRSRRRRSFGPTRACLPA